MVKGPGINGVTVGVIAGGALLIFSGLKNFSIIDGLRQIAKGQTPAGTTPSNPITKANQPAANEPNAINDPLVSPAGWSMPLPAGRFSFVRGFTPPTHYGVDWAAAAGTPIYAARDGVVAAITSNSAPFGGYGNSVYLDHSMGFHSLYGHMSKFGPITKGQSVKAGTVIGYVGMTGQATGNHLHFEIRQGGGGPLAAVKVNPLSYVKGT